MRSDSTSSGPSDPGPGRVPPDDRTSRARIRDAAITLVAQRGTAALSARAVATAAGVSAGLVIHHFGSMDALRTACDEHVVAVIRERKQEAFAGGGGHDVMAVLREQGMVSFAAYLAAVLSDDSPAVAHLVDEMVADAEAYLERGVATGMLRASEDPHGRAVVLTLWGLGALVMNPHLKRLLDVDLTAPDLGHRASTAAYLGPVQELYAHGIFTPMFAEQLSTALHADPTQQNARATSSSPPTEGELR
ncbi:MAG TPA: TetR family transcriptional regulator [Polyangiaceae bacterium]|nr:TetR family transcriptional regulator [Polyangiaceae bacterium]